MKITSHNIIIRLPYLTDTHAMVAYLERNREHFKLWGSIKPGHFYTEVYWQQQFTHVDPSTFHFLLFESNPTITIPEEENPIIGEIKITMIKQYPSYSCDLGYKLDALYQGKGYMTQSLRTVIEWLCMHNSMHRINAYYMPKNVKSAAVLARLGFLPEGYARDFLYINGKWEDHILVSYINAQWHATIPM